MGVPCIVQASLGSVAPGDILLHSLCLERSISSDGADFGLQPSALTYILLFLPCLQRSYPSCIHAHASLPIKTPFIMQKACLISVA